MHLRGEDVRDGGRERQEVDVHLRGDGIDRDGGTAVDPAKELAVDAPVDVLDHDADEYIQHEREHLADELEVVAGIGAEAEGDLQLEDAVADVDDAAEDREDQREYRHRDGAVSNQQQGDHNQRVEYLLSHGDDLLEEIALMDCDIGLEDRDGEGERGVDRHDPKELYAEGNLLRGELCAEDDVPVIAQPQADDEHDRPLHGVGQQEHAVELAHAVPIVRGLEAGIVANIRAAEAEGEQAQIRDNGEYKLIDAILAVTETADHDRRIDEGDDGAQYDGDIGQHRTGTHLIDFHAGTSRKGRLLYVR